MPKIESRPVAPAPSRPDHKPRRDLYPDARATSHRRYRSVSRLSGGLAKTVLMSLGLATAAAFPAAARDIVIKDAGVGVIAGDPIGGTAKLGLSALRRRLPFASTPGLRAAACTPGPGIRSDA